jgi:hypothetical protein
MAGYSSIGMMAADMSVSILTRSTLLFIQLPSSLRRRVFCQPLNFTGSTARRYWENNRQAGVLTKDPCSQFNPRENGERQGY